MREVELGSGRILLIVSVQTNSSGRGGEGTQLYKHLEADQTLFPNKNIVRYSLCFEADFMWLDTLYTFNVKTLIFALNFDVWGILETTSARLLKY